MFFNWALYISVAVCLLGLLYRLWKWIFVKSEIYDGESLERKRTAVIIKNAASLFSGANIWRVSKGILFDIIIQWRILKQDRLRWLMHVSIFYGFILLVLMHALGAVVMAPLFGEYEPTINPFLFLRNLLGVLTLTGLFIAVFRRIRIGKLRRITHRSDVFALSLLLVIIISGFLLEAVKIVSHPVFYQMVEDYAGLEEPEELDPLKAVWVRDYGVVFPDMEEPVDEELYEAGFEINEEYCAACHSSPKSAFVSYPLAGALKGVALSISAGRIDIWLYYIHFLACFLGLALLPFSKFLHFFSTPFNLIADRGRERIKPDYTPAAPGALELDACMNCGTCSLHCSVEPVFRELTNSQILPSERLKTLGRQLSKDSGLPQKLIDVSEGNRICTRCFRCTLLCPAGINLQGIWLNLREDLAGKGYNGPMADARASIRKSEEAPSLTPEPRMDRLRVEFTGIIREETFSNCFRCQTCTNVCPVVANYSDPPEELDLTPHQIMHCLGLGLRELALSSRMIWDCLTCYACQEHCPQGVRVTEVLYDLKNQSFRRRRILIDDIIAHKKELRL